MLLCALSSSCGERLNSVLAYAQMKNEILGGFRVMVFENERSLHRAVADREDKR